jgi:hypothetical protein
LRAGQDLHCSKKEEEEVRAATAAGAAPRAGPYMVKIKCPTFKISKVGDGSRYG